jgi:hypothetical protein
MMRMFLKPCYVIAVALASLACFAMQARAQSPWEDYLGKSVINLRYLNTSFDAGSENWTVSGRLAFLDVTGNVSERATLVVSVPYAHFGESYEYDDYYYSYSHHVNQDLLGNPYIGVRGATAIPYFSYEFGIRVPLASNETREKKMAASVTGAYSNIDEMEAFTLDYLPILAGLSINVKNEEGLFTRFKIYPVLWTYVGSDEYDVDETELVLHYGAVSGFEDQGFRIQWGISGISLLTKSHTEKDPRILVDDTALNQFGMDMGYRLGNIWPGFYFRVPFDETINDDINFVWGFSLSYEGF